MSDRCGCDRDGRYCHAGELCKNDGPCPCCAPVRGLDFEAALLTLKGAAWDFPRRIKDHLNAQLAERVAEARREEREKAKAVADLLEPVLVVYEANTGKLLVKERRELERLYREAR